MALRHCRGGKTQRQILGLRRPVPTRRFIPDGDSDFANKARNFALQIKEDPGRYFISGDDAERIDRAVQAFRDALAKSYSRVTRSMQVTMLKDQARKEAEKIVRKFGAMIRLNDEIAPIDKTIAGVDERRKPVRREDEGILVTPHLGYVGTTGEGTMQGHKHVLEFWDFSGSTRRHRPREASRLELFVELVEPEADHPRASRRTRGRADVVFAARTRAARFASISRRRSDRCGWCTGPGGRMRRAMSGRSVGR